MIVAVCDLRIVLILQCIVAPLGIHFDCTQEVVIHPQIKVTYTCNVNISHMR